MPQQTPALSLLASPVRRSIVDLLVDLPVVPTAAESQTRSTGLTAAQIGERVGLHVTTVRFHLDQLVAGDLLIAYDVRAGVGRPRRHYAINPRSPQPTRPDTYRLLAEVLAESVATAQSGAPDLTMDAAAQWVERHRSAIVPACLSVGQATSSGHFLAKVGALVDVLQAWGYGATVQTRDHGRTAELALRHCPVKELAQQNPSVVCGLHRDLVRATMAALGEPDSITGLSPFVQPDLCLVRVSSNRPFSPLEAQS